MTRPIVIQLGLLLLVAGAARADLPAARLTSVFPPGAQRGTFREVAVTGADLDDLSALRFSHPGITARPALDPAGRPRPNAFVVAVWPDVPAGVYDVRAVGRFGVSNVRGFAVGEAAEVVEGASNTSPGGATELAVNATASGQCAAGAADHFRVGLKQGQRVQIACAARQVDSKLEPVVTLADALGRELARSRNGDVLDVTTPADGSYVVQVHDATYRGGPEYFYRLSASTAPQADFILPPAAVPGTRGKFVLYGRNLPGGTPAEGFNLNGGKLEQLAVEIDVPPAAAGPSPCELLTSPAQSALGGFAYRLRTDRGASNPVVIAHASSAPAAEQAANDTPAAAQKLSVPCEVAGQFFPRGDRDWFSFDARKGDVFQVEVVCQRLGLPADPFLLVQRVTKNDKGEEQAADVQEVYDADANAGGPDFNTAGRDPSYRLEAKEDGVYRVQVRDLFNTLRDDPRLVYRLSVRRETPDFSLAVLPARADPKALPKPPLLRRGGSAPVRVVALRRDGFNGEIELAAEALSAGVTCPPSTVPAGAAGGVLVFTAAEDAAGWAGPVRIVGRARMGGAEIVREARGAAVLWEVPDPPTEPVRTRLTADGFPLAVSAADVQPLSIEPAEAKPLEAAAGAKLKVPLKVKVRTGAGGKLKVKPAGHPAFGNAAEIEIDAKAGDASVELDLDRHKLPPGTHTLYLRAEGAVKYARNPEAAKAADEAKGLADKAAADAAAAAKQAAEKLAAAKAGTDAEATKAAEKAATEADAAAKAAGQQNQEAAKRAQDLAPKDTPAVIFSAPVVVKVSAAK